MDTFAQVASQWYNLENSLIDALDVYCVTRERYLLENCIQVLNNFIKGVSIIEGYLRKVVIVDNSPVAYALQIMRFS
eukprot:jgi/Galph1/405/GphlegSOOS_G5296.1